MESKLNCVECDCEVDISIAPKTGIITFDECEVNAELKRMTDNSVFIEFYCAECYKQVNDVESFNT